MRALLLFALIAALAYGVWQVLGPESEAPGRAPPPRSEPDREEPEPRPVPRTVTLVLTVRSAQSTIPPGTVAGYRWAGEDRVRAVDAEGKVVFTDAPAGDLTLIARAPGYEEIAQRRYLSGGVPASAILTLERRKKP